MQYPHLICSNKLIIIMYGFKYFHNVYYISSECNDLDYGAEGHRKYYDSLSILC